ncbi:unnamed protein product [Rhodiola kirilowii]
MASLTMGPPQPPPPLLSPSIPSSLLNTASDQSTRPKLSPPLAAPKWMSKLSPPLSVLDLAWIVTKTSGGGTQPQ